MTRECWLILFSLKCLILNVLSDITPACHCVVFTSNGHSQGTFTSPDYRQGPYRSNINCILYTFVGEMGEIVELEFIEFDLQPADVTNRCIDYLKFFLDLERPEVNERTKSTYVRCGGLDSIERRHYSSDRSLVLEFHTDKLQSNHSGFLGRFSFIPEEQFEFKGGTQRYGSEFSWDFWSTNNKTGRFFSPRYPQNYPPNSNCFYVFYASEKERVKIVFKNIQMDSPDPTCLANPDTIVVRDGVESSAPVIARYCSANSNNQEVISSGQFLYIEFRSDHSGERKGFAAMFEFIEAHTLPVDEHLSQDDRPVVTMLPGAATLIPPSSNCEFTYSSTKAKSGEIVWPRNPGGGSYSAQTSCLFKFYAAANERVQLKFEDFGLIYHDGNADNPDNDCKDEDSVKVVTSDGREELLIDTFCGRRLPKWLMSSGPNMTMIFTANDREITRGTHQGTGFRATYAFVTDFGIKTGSQKPFDSSTSCTFEFNSKDSTNGTFTSPNYPGLYPRNTECHYVFQAERESQIYITFPFFDVEGITPKCEEGTDSDFVEFSNFNVGIKDRKMPRFCGAKGEHIRREVHSDGNFFRVTFQSNEKYDATGFDGRYQFRKIAQDPFATGDLTATPGRAPHTGLSFSTIFTGLFILLATNVIQL